MVHTITLLAFALSQPADHKTFAVEGFTSIAVGGGVRFECTVGPKYSVEMEGDASVLRNFEARVKDKRLVVSNEHGYSTEHPVILRISTPKLEGLSLSGGVAANVKGINAGNFRLTASGGVTGKLSGKASGLESQFSGGVQLQLPEITGGEVLVRASGGCDLTFKGSASKLALQASGGCNLNFEGLVAKVATVNSSGACSIRLHVTDKLTASASGASKIHYSGHPTTHFNYSGESEISGG